MATNGGDNFADIPFLRHCDKETAQPVTGSVKGNIPSWLQGELIRVGPGIQKIGNDQYKHVFDGLAILHKFHVKDGKASYQSKALRSDAYKKNMEANRIVVSEFGTYAYPDPCQSLFGRLKTEFQAISSVFTKSVNPSAPEITDNCSVNVAYYGDQLYAMTETNFVRKFDPTNLDTLGEKTNISDYVAVNTATAHPHVLEDGSIINIGTNFRHKKGPHYCFIKVPPSFNSEKSSFENAKLIAEIPSRWKLHTAYFHSFGITNSGKLIFVEYPYCLNVLGLAAGGFMRKSFREWLTWYPNEKTRIYVVSMDDGKLHPVVYETEKLFLFHHINAFEENGEVIIDVAGYSDAEWVHHITKDDTRKSGNLSENPSARRYVLPLNIESANPGENLVKTKTDATATLRSGTKDTVDLTPHKLTEGVSELPRINYSRNGKKYSYFYGLGEKEATGTYDLSLDIIHKVNVNTGEALYWTSKEDIRISEPVFVPDPTKANPEEDDGVVLTALLARDKPNKVTLLVLNAKDMTELARSDFTAAGAVTATFHGQWAQAGEKLHTY